MISRFLENEKPLPARGALFVLGFVVIREQLRRR
jgi:hypothetical protein